jgi:putative endopeptidase
MNHLYRRLAVAVALCAVACFAADPIAAQNVGNPLNSVSEIGVDPSITPGDDFFAYANGDWLKNTPIPAGLQRWTARNDIDALTHRQVAELIKDSSAAPAGSVARKVADFRSAFLNEVAIEARGLAPVAPLLDHIGAARDKAALSRLLGEGVQADVDPLNFGVFSSSSPLGLSVEPGIGGEKTYVAFLLQGGLGLPGLEDYASPEPAMQALRAAYKDYIGRVLGLAGFDRSAQRADAVMALEAALAQTQATGDAAESDHNAGNLWSRDDFAREAPGMDWPAFFAAAGLARQQDFVAWQPTAVRGVASLVASQPLEAWQDYLRFHLLDRYADVLPRGIAEPALAFHGLVENGEAAPPLPREQRALAAIQSNLGDALGQMYAERYFPPAQKARLQAIVANVEAALCRRVEAVTWMSPSTKAIALGKLQTLYVGLGYPEKYPDYSQLAVDPADAFGNQRRSTERTYRRAVAQLGQPVDMTEWWMTPQTVGAILVFQQNALEFPAALLQAPKFDPAASDATVYGAIGAIIGHESSHFVDPLGAEYEAGGRKRRWWSDEDAKQFRAASEPLVKQFSSYHPFPGVAIDGNLTSSENIADLAGLTAAFEAYRLTLGSRASDREFVRRKDREFFIAFARSWRSKSTEKALRKQAATSDHAPETYRVATVRNLDAWYDAFDVQPGQRLYLEPSARVRVW